MVEDQDQSNIEEIFRRIEALEQRMSRFEAKIPPRSEEEAALAELDPFDQLKQISDSSFLESKVGESGLAWLGNIVLFIGITFLEQYFLNLGYHWIPILLGYALVIGIFLLYRFLKPNYPRMASIFNLNALLILYYTTLGLHFFTPGPIVDSKILGIALLLAVVVIHFVVSLKRSSAWFTALGIVLLAITGIVSNDNNFLGIVAITIAALGLFFMVRYSWISLLYLSVVLVYLIGLIWFLNNPLAGNPMQAIAQHGYGFLYLFVSAVIFSLSALAKENDAYSTGGVVGAIVLNGLGFSVLLLLTVITFFKDDYVAIVGSISAFCLLYSIMLQIRSPWKITAALYALYGFVTLSLALYVEFQLPQAYFMLALQSLLVVIMAIWFRSKFIVFINTLLYLLLLVFYLRTPELIDGVNVSFTLVALLTARILNWKKDRLTIKTEMLRNAYLIIGFVMVLVTLYHMIPDRYITISWAAVAVIYFVLSLFLNNVKYRYMALGTMLAAAFYLFIVDLATIELAFRIVALMVLAVISIGLSIFYTRRSQNKRTEE